jgi:hypothetical protein
MDLSSHQLSSLFDQLGLDSEPNAIAAFVKEYSPLASNILLADAKFWTDSQASFLREEILKDSDWAEVIDQLNEILHAKS